MSNNPQGYLVNFTDGTAGPCNISYGTYTFRLASVGYPNGYLGGAFSPPNLTVNQATGRSVIVGLAAQGKAVLTLAETNTGTPIVGASFTRFLNPPPYSGIGYTPNPGVIADNGDGTYTFRYLPYNTNTVIPVYFQVIHPSYGATDFTIRMNNKMVVVPDVINMIPNKATVSFYLSDQYYKYSDMGIPLSGQIALSLRLFTPDG